MAQRRKIGILFSYSEGWIGGSYYFMNLVHSFSYLREEDKPEVVVLSENPASLEKMRETGYPHITFLHSHFHYALWERIINKLSRMLVGKNILQKGHSKKDLPVLLGYYEQLPLYKCARKLFWIPDFQDKYYPQHLGEEVANARKVQHEQLAYSHSEVVFSSQDAKKDFEKFYPHSTCKKHVVPFAVSLPDLSSLSVAEVFSKYGIDTPYYFSPNQFWRHKNHEVVLKAVRELKEADKHITVIFTGNEKTGGGKYAEELKAYVKTHGLEAVCQFLGFIDRKDQLLLMREAKAVIQPSLFEGWSTVVEDAKCLGKWLILSDLRVHREQISQNVSFFDPNNAESLKQSLIDFETSSHKVSQINYEENIRHFAQSLIQIL